MYEREVVREPVHEREVVVDREAPVERDVVVHEAPRRGGGAGVVAAIVGVLLLVLLGWFALRALNVMGDAADSEVEVDVPEEINVDAEG